MRLWPVSSGNGACPSTRRTERAPRRAHAPLTSGSRSLRRRVVKGAARPCVQNPPASAPPGRKGTRATSTRVARSHHGRRLPARAIDSTQWFKSRTPRRVRTRGDSIFSSIAWAAQLPATAICQAGRGPANRWSSPRPRGKSSASSSGGRSPYDLEDLNRWTAVQSAFMLASPWTERGIPGAHSSMRSLSSGPAAASARPSPMDGWPLRCTTWG